jgi:hypothetical protein
MHVGPVHMSTGRQRVGVDKHGCAGVLHFLPTSAGCELHNAKCMEAPMLHPLNVRQRLHLMSARVFQGNLAVLSFVWFGGFLYRMGTRSNLANS